MKKEHLSLRRNSDLVNQQAKRLAKWLVENLENRFPKTPLHDIFGREDLERAGFNDLRFVYVCSAVIIDHGWLTAEILMGMKFYERQGAVLEGLYRSKSNNKIGNRTTYVKTGLAKGRKVYGVTITMMGGKRHYIVCDRVSGRVFPSRFGELYSPDWDAGHPDAIEHMKKNWPVGITLDDLYSFYLDEEEFEGVDGEI